MKIREGFVSNSSSTSFVIVNKTDKRLDLKEFVIENPQLIEEYDEDFGFDEDESKEKILEQMIKDAQVRKDYSKKKPRPLRLAPGENLISFGDEECTTLGKIYDYILRDGGESKRFKWRFDHYNR